MKYGARDLRDVLERASARESAARVAAGAVCKLLLARVRHRGRERRPLASARPSDDGSPRSASPSLEQRARGLAACARSTRASRPKMVAAVDAAQEGRRDARRLDPRRRARRAGRASDLTPPGTASSTAASGSAPAPVPAVKAVELGSAIEASRGPGSRAARRDRERVRRDACAAAPIARAASRRGVTNGEDVIAVAVHEADLDAGARPRLGGPRDRRSPRASRLRAQRRDSPFGLRRRSARRCSRSCSPTRCSS